MPTIGESKTRIQGWLLYYFFNLFIDLKCCKIKVGEKDALGIKIQLCMWIKGALFH